jgi:hypothetical protein
MLSSPDESQRLKRPVEGFIPNPKLRLEEQCRDVMRFKRFSFRTEQAYWDWIKRGRGSGAWEGLSVNDSTLHSSESVAIKPLPGHVLSGTHTGLAKISAD